MIQVLIKYFFTYKGLESHINIKPCTVALLCSITLQMNILEVNSSRLFPLMLTKSFNLTPWCFPAPQVCSMLL